jgi:hypothetical protein
MDIDNGLIFDTRDIDYLTSNLSREQLIREIHTADAEEGVARCFGEDADRLYWNHFVKASELALAIKKANQPKVEVKEGQFSVRAFKEANDVVDVIGQYTKLRKAGKEYVGRCPFHKDKTPSLQVSQSKQVYYCFSCQRKGDSINFIMQIEDVDTKQACLLLGK